MTSAFKELVAGSAKKAGPPPRRAAPKVVELPLSAFAETWANRHQITTTQRVGLRLVGDDVIERARWEAARLAFAVGESEEAAEVRVEAYNHIVLRVIVGNAVCDPGDVTKAWIPYAETVLEEALTPRAIGFLFNELDALSVATSPAIDPLPLASIDALVARLPELAGMEPAKALAARRYLRKVLDLINGSP